MPPKSTTQKLPLEKLPLEKIVTDAGTQPREHLDHKRAEEYGLAMQDGDVFPPATVFTDGNTHWLADGFHRYLGAKKQGFKELDCEIRKGTLRDAQLFASSANATHGLNRTPADKRRSITLLLLDPDWSQWPDREIARQTKTSPTLVGKVREELRLAERAKNPQTVPVDTPAGSPEEQAEKEAAREQQRQALAAREGLAVSPLSEKEEEHKEPVPQPQPALHERGSSEPLISEDFHDQEPQKAGIWASTNPVVDNTTLSAEVTAEVLVPDAEVTEEKAQDPVWTPPTFERDPSRGLVTQAVEWVVREMEGRVEQPWGLHLRIWVVDTLKNAVLQAEEERKVALAREKAAPAGTQSSTPKTNGKPTPKTGEAEAPKKRVTGKEVIGKKAE